ncbi:MAG: hypothetical protein K2N53_03020, partial [Clostridia bacterium]|nr:hypothetical protein [Clostridia bacterium]
MEEERNDVLEKTQEVEVTTDQVEANDTTQAEPLKEKNKLDKFFGITKSRSTFKTEIVAGLTTFMSMVYALLVVPGMYGDKVT